MQRDGLVAGACAVRREAPLLRIHRWIRPRPAPPRVTGCSGVAVVGW